MKLVIAILLWSFYCVLSSEEMPKYDRSYFGGWKDVDKDGINTRNEVLIQEAVDSVIVYKGLVKDGTWVCPYTGDTIKEPGLLDIDHLVPLKEAWISGAYKWNKTKLEDYNNYIAHKDELVAVTIKANRSKGDKDIVYWLPKKDTCDYLRKWIDIKDHWDLEIDSAEIAFLLGFETKCNNNLLKARRK